MGLRKLLENLNIIQALPDKPTNTATELKQQFDLSGNKIKTYINETLTEDLDSALSTINTTLTNINSTLETKANSSDVKLKGDFAIFTSIGINNESFSYPQGFNRENSIVISVMHNVQDNGEEYFTIDQNDWHYGIDQHRSSLNYFNRACSVTLKQDKIYLNKYYTNAYAKYKIVLMKIS